MRIGLIGVGRIGAFHAGTLAGLDRIDDLVIADAVPGRAAEVATSVGGASRSVESIDELFAAGVEGVVITAATPAHAGLITHAVDLGLTTFCEKPVAESVASSVAVRDHVEKAGGTVHIGFQRRFDQGYRAAKAAVQSGELGWIHTIRSGTHDQAPPDAAYIPISGGIYNDCLVHDFDIIRWTTGLEFVEIYATGANRGAAFFAEAGDVDAAAALATLEDGTLVQMSGGRYNAAGHDVRMELLGSLGSVAIGLNDRTPLKASDPGVNFPTGKPYENFMDRFSAAYTAELIAFTEVVAGEIESPCTVRDAVNASVGAQAAELSRAEGRPVRFSEVAV